MREPFMQGFWLVKGKQAPGVVIYVPQISEVGFYAGAFVGKWERFLYTGEAIR